MTINLLRDRSSLMIRFFMLGSFSFFMWLFLFRIKDNQESIQDRIGFFYQSGQVPAYVGLLNSVALCEYTAIIYSILLIIALIRPLTSMC